MVGDPRDQQENFKDAKQESQDGNKESKNPGWRGRRRPADAWS